ncbi:Uncharacterized protein DBV15_10071, partial [Temnothorax longispinosus]
MKTEETVTIRRAYSMLNLSIPDIATVNSSVFEGSIESTSVSIESRNVTMINESATQSVNISSQIENVDGILYLYGTPPLILFCIISIVVNIKVLMSVFWIRRPLSPTLYISLSLAGSFVIGWMPGVMMYMLVCNNCVLQLNGVSARGMFLIYATINGLIILKTLVNPIIYAARMHEIK